MAIYDLKNLILTINAVDKEKIEKKGLLYTTEPWMRELTTKERAHIYGMFMNAEPDE